MMKRIFYVLLALFTTFTILLGNVSFANNANLREKHVNFIRVESFLISPEPEKENIVEFSLNKKFCEKPAYLQIFDKENQLVTTLNIDPKRITETKDTYQIVAILPKGFKLGDYKVKLNGKGVFNSFEIEENSKGLSPSEINTTPIPAIPPSAKL
jgi:hypothetical protein